MHVHNRIRYKKKTIRENVNSLSENDQVNVFVTHKSEIKN